MHGGRPQHACHIDRGVADRHDRIKGGNLCGETVEIDELIYFSIINQTVAGKLLQYLEIAFDVAILQRDEIR